MSLGSRIREYRLKRGFTQNFIASKLGMTEANFSSYERDKSVPPSEKLKEISKLLGVSTDYLLGREPEDGSDYNKRLTDLKDLFEEEGFSIRERNETGGNNLFYIISNSRLVQKISESDFYNHGEWVLKNLINIKDLQTIAAHHEGDDWTEDELEEIEQFKAFVRMKRQQKNN